MKPMMRPVAIRALMLALSAAFPTSAAYAQSGRLLWSHEIGGQFWAPLLHHDGRLYFGSDDSSFRAFNIGKQEVVWRYETGGIIRSGAEIAGGTVLFASDDGFLYALDADSGTELWRFDLGSAGVARVLPAADPPFEYDYMHSSPVHHEGVVYVGSSDGALYAINVATGEQHWRFETEGKIRSTPVVDGGNVYFGSWDSHVYAVDALSGDPVWRFDTGNVVQGSPALGDGKVFIGSRAAAVFAIDEQTGEQAWKHVHPDGSWVESSPVFSEGVVYIGSSDARALFALDGRTGATLWRFETGGWSWSTPLIADRAIYIGSLSAYPYYFEGVDLRAGIFAVERASGEALWGFTPEPIEGYVTGGVFSTPALVNGVLYVGALDGRLYALKM